MLLLLNDPRPVSLSVAGVDSHSRRYMEGMAWFASL